MTAGGLSVRHLNTVGPRATEQLKRLGRIWTQGQHIFLTGPTGSGKTELAHKLCEIRADRGGHVIVMVMKPKEDPTITHAYKNYVRWTDWRRRPPSYENRILLWPDVKKARGDKDAILEIQRKVFLKAYAALNVKGNYTVQVDEGLYNCAPAFLNMSDHLGMAHSIGRSGRLTMITLAQRPSHLPLLLYGSASHAFVGRTREQADVKRMSELGSREGSRELGARIGNQGLHDFLWVPVAADWPAEPFNLAQ